LIDSRMSQGVGEWISGRGGLAEPVRKIKNLQSKTEHYWKKKRAP